MIASASMRCERCREALGCFRSAFVGDAKKTQRMMFGRTGLAPLTNDLVHYPTSPVTAVADSSQNSAQPRFKSGTQGIRKKDRDVKRRLVLQQPNNLKKRSIW